MIVSATQRLYIEFIDDGIEVSKGFKQGTYKTIGDILSGILSDVPEEIKDVVVFPITGGHCENITEVLAEAWLEEYGDLVREGTKKPVYVANSEAWYEYAHDNRDRY